jgi:hypothetical protein
VHAQAGRGVDLDDAAALGLQRRSMVSQTTSTPQMSRPMVLGRGDGARGHLGVHVVGHVGGGAAGGQVGVVAQDHALALGRARSRRQ